MKSLIVGLALSILFVSFTIYQQDHNSYIRALESLKYVADECSASASLYFDKSEYAEGRMVFNQSEGIKAIEYILKKGLKLDDSLNPLPNTYWTEQVDYKVYFYDDSNSTFPFLFVDPDTSFTKTISEPTVIVTINAGKPRYRLSFITASDAIRSSSYEYEGR
jgi:hypothetical protein